MKDANNQLEMGKICNLYETIVSGNTDDFICFNNKFSFNIFPKYIR